MCRCRVQWSIRFRLSGTRCATVPESLYGIIEYGPRIVESDMSHVNPAELAYGSDKTGLVWGYLFEPGKPPRQVECDAALHWLATPPTLGEQSGFVWLHLSLSNAAAERWMRQSLQLADAFYESLHEGVGSTRLEVEGDTLVAVMHDVLFNLSFDAANISTVSVCMDPRVVVTARLRPLRSVDRLRASVKPGRPSDRLRSFSPSCCMIRPMCWSTSFASRPPAPMPWRMDCWPNRIASSRIELSSLRRSLVRLQRLLAPEPAALFRLLNRPPTWLSEDEPRRPSPGS